MLFLCKAAHTIRESERQILLLSHRAPAGRLAMLVSRLTAPGPRGALALPRAERALASYLGLTTRQFTGAVETLAAAGILRVDEDTLTVVDARRLQRLALESPPPPRRVVHRRRR
jgi:CRP-like cAMP-binding protein